MSTTNTTSFLARKKEQVNSEIRLLQTHSLKEGEHKIKAIILERVSVKPLSLGQPKPVIREDGSNRVDVSWPCTGDGNMLGIPDATGYCPPFLLGQRSVTKTYITATFVPSDDAALEALQSEIRADTKDMHAYIDRINAEIAPHNEFINSTVPDLVNKRLAELHKLQDAQDFLSS